MRDDNHSYECLLCGAGPEILYEVKREDVLHRIKLDSYYVGDIRKTAENSIPATKSQASDDNDDILNPFINTAASEVNDIMTALLSHVRIERKEYITAKGFPSIQFDFYLTVPPTFDVNQNAAILTAIEDFMVNYALGEWFKRTNPEIARIYTDLTEVLKVKLQHRINQRVKPIKRPVPPLGF